MKQKFEDKPSNSIEAKAQFILRKRRMRGAELTHKLSRQQNSVYRVTWGKNETLRYPHMGWLMQKRCNSIANALEFFCINLWICSHLFVLFQFPGCGVKVHWPPRGVGVSQGAVFCRVCPRKQPRLASGARHRVLSPLRPTNTAAHSGTNGGNRQDRWNYPTK